MRKYLFCFLSFAILLFINAATRVEAPQALKQKAIEIYNRGNYKEAIKFNLKNLNSYPDDETLLIYLAYSYEQINQLDNAEKRYIEILKLNNENFYAKKGLSYLYIRQVKYYINLNKYNLALDLLNKGLYYLPEEIDFYYLDAEISMALRDFSGAYNQWQEAFDKTNNNSTEITNLYAINKMAECALNLGDLQLKKYKDFVVKLHEKFSNIDELTLLTADALFYCQEEPYLRNKYRNQVMANYLKTAGTRTPLEVFLPVKGNWMIMSGNYELCLDTHNGYDAFCIDLSKINEYGGRLIGGYGSENSDYLAYNENIYCVYDGIVVKASDLVRDNPVGKMNWLSTNMVKIKHEQNGQVFYSVYI
ncbi:MAG: hypothetical protein MUC95_08980, partial [Spirochaetes bacterium]|nr:hypothetical protein [Spirochaetota bacterium]